MCAISCTARSKASWLALDGLVVPAILRTYCSAAALISSLRRRGLEVVEGVDVPAHAFHGTPGAGVRSEIAIQSPCRAEAWSADRRGRRATNAIEPTNGDEDDHGSRDQERAQATHVRTPARLRRTCRAAACSRCRTAHIHCSQLNRIAMKNVTGMQQPAGHPLGVLRWSGSSRTGPARRTAAARCSSQVSTRSMRATMLELLHVDHPHHAQQHEAQREVEEQLATSRRAPPTSRHPR